MAWDAATGITSGTHRPNPDVRPWSTGEPQAPIAIPVRAGHAAARRTTSSSGRRQPGQPHDARRRSTPTWSATAPCSSSTAPRARSSSRPRSSTPASSARPRRPSSPARSPAAGSPAIGDFAACVRRRASTSTFEGPSGFDATGTADTWSERAAEEPDRLGLHEHPHRRGRGPVARHRRRRRRLAHPRHRAPRRRASTCRPASPGPAERRPSTGAAPVIAGDGQRLRGPVFSNGSDGARATVDVRGPRRARRRARSSPPARWSVGGLRAAASSSSTFDPGHEGHVDLYTVVDPADELDEAIEDNNVQKASAAGPARADPSGADRRRRRPRRHRAGLRRRPGRPRHPVRHRREARLRGGDGGLRRRDLGQHPRPRPPASSTRPTGRRSPATSTTAASCGCRRTGPSRRSLLTEHGRVRRPSWFGVDVGRHRLLLRHRPVRDGRHPRRRHRRHRRAAGPALRRQVRARRGGDRRSAT